MSDSRNPLVLSLVLLLATLLSACASTGNQAGDSVGEPPKDSFEGFNRAMYKFNDTVDGLLLKPAAQGYKAITPAPVRKGISNVFSNLGEPVTIVNDFLQGKFSQGLQDITRFVYNTVFGLFGIFDVATHMDAPKHNEDFGQTLAVWGVGEGPYVVWPFLGPSNVRDSVGMVADWEVDPIYRIKDDETFWAVVILKSIDTRARFLGAKDVVAEASSGDPYVFIREAYRQKRIDLIYDGNPPFDDSLLFEDEAPAPEQKK